MPIERYELVEDFGTAILAGNAALFVGAGLSQGAGLPGWTGLLAPLQERFDVPDDPDLALVAEYIVNAAGDRQVLEDHILKALTPTPSPKPGLPHRLIARLRVSQVWTSNYESLIERAMAAADLDVSLAIDEDSVHEIASNRDRAVIKMHGSLDDAGTGWLAPPVITRTDYERYEFDHQRMWTVLRASYLSRTMLFLGFSFVDPNVGILLRLARTLKLADRDRHMAVMRRPGPEKPDDLRRHELQVADLENSGVRVCEIREFNEIDGILTDLLRRTRPERLFVAGSSGEPGASGASNEQILGEYTLAIARELDAETDWEIASLSGAAGWLVTRDVARLRRIDGRYDPAKLTLHFRHRDDPPVPLPERVGTATYTDLDRDRLVIALLDESRAMLVIRGGDRTREEIELASARSVGVVPLACSGGAAHDYWSERLSDPPILGGRPTDPASWAALGDENPQLAAEAAHMLLRQAMYQA